MEPRTENVDARSSLATWLREGRNRKQLSIEEVARITKIQLRILERLESGQYDGLPADVFVKGFVRSFAKCVGLDESEALDRYGAAAQQAQPTQGVAVAQAMVETLVPITQRKIDLFAPGPVEPVVETPPVREAPLIEARPLPKQEQQIVEPPKAEEVVEAEAPKKKRSKKKHTNPAPRSRRGKKTKPESETIATSIDTAPVAKIDATSVDATVEAKSDPAITVAESTLTDGAVAEPSLAEGSARISQQSIEAADRDAIEAAGDRDAAIEAAGRDAAIDGAGRDAAIDGAGRDAAIETTGRDAAIDGAGRDAIEAAGRETDRDASESTELATSDAEGTWQPTMPPVSTTPSVPWRSNVRRPAAAPYVVPSLVIDDADPDSADRTREDRLEKESKLSFLPPILLDREDRSARQGGLTLAVIILLIAATLTLSYLMRRPTPSGDGVTMLVDHVSARHA